MHDRIARSSSATNVDTAPLPTVRLKGLFRRSTKWLSVLAPLCYFFPKIMLFYFLFGVYDVIRNTKLNFTLFQSYFVGNGVLTWILSPFNVLLDILALPYINKGVIGWRTYPCPTRTKSGD